MITNLSDVLACFAHDTFAGALRHGGAASSTGAGATALIGVQCIVSFVAATMAQTQGEPMNIELVPTLERLVQEKVRSGHYRSASEVVGEALRLMEQRDQRHNDLRDQLRHALETQRRGDLVDGEAVFDRLEAELKALDTSGV